jgi:hypothetical protein
MKTIIRLARRPYNRASHPFPGSRMFEHQTRLRGKILFQHN